MTDFRLLQGIENLHLYLGCDEAWGRFLLTATDEELFVRHEIPKPNGRGTRRVWAAKDDRVGDTYKTLARKLDQFVRGRLPGFPHPAAHGYLAHRSTLTNARAHLGASAVLNADIRAFFQSIGTERVVALFRQLGLSDEAARTMATIVARASHLPLGLHTSPLLANVICTDLDTRLSLLVPGGRYTRYADDLSFSGPALPSKADIEEELAKDGFALAQDKWRFARAGRGLYVTGLSLEDKVRPRVPKEMKRRLRQDLYYCKRWGLVEHLGYRGYGNVQSGINKIDGLISYIRGVERDIGGSFETAWRDILDEAAAGVSYASQNVNAARDVLFLVDESVIARPTGRVLALALVVIEDADVVRASLSALLKTLRNDPYGATNKIVLDKRGLHWNELAHDDRTKATERVRALPFRCFIAFSTLLSDEKAAYVPTYERLLSKLVQGRLVRYDRCRIDIVAEENSKIELAQISTAVSSAYARLVASDSRRPEYLPAVRQAKKGADAACPLPDITLGIFGEYARAKIKAAEEAGEPKKRASGAQAESRFEQMRDKIRAIFDLDTGIVYSRSLPFQSWEPGPESVPGFPPRTFEGE
jgi:RNA-directed DNA polymerase